MTEQLRSPRDWAYSNGLETVGAWLLALLWISPLLYAFWAAFHPSEYAVNFELFAPITLENFGEALSQAPFLQYGLNTFMLSSFAMNVGIAEDGKLRAQTSPGPGTIFFLNIGL